VHLLLSKLTSHCLKGKFTHCTHFTLHTSHYTLYIASSLLAFTLHPSDGSSDSDHYSASDVPCQDRYVTKGQLLWREAWAMRVLGLMKDEDSARNKNIRSALPPSTFTLHTLHTSHCTLQHSTRQHITLPVSHFTLHISGLFKLIQAWVAAQAAADSASAAVYSHVEGPPHQHGAVIVPPMDAHDAQCRCLDCENKLFPADVQVAPPQQHCLIDPLNLWKALPPVPKYMDMTAKHPTDSDSYNSADESESELSSGFVSANDDGIPDAHAEWVEEMCPITARALRRAKVGTFIKQKRPPQK
jgi:hypothetical protein